MYPLGGSAATRQRRSLRKVSSLFPCVGVGTGDPWLPVAWELYRSNQRLVKWDLTVLNPPCVSSRRPFRGMSGSTINIGRCLGYVKGP